MIRISRQLAALAASATFATTAAFMALAPATAAAQQIKQPGDFPTVQLSAGMFLIKAEVAANEADREQGLMYRTKMAPNAGMLFVFEQRAMNCFWMRNTNLPLSIAFLRDDGTIVNIEDMAPQTDDNHCPKEPIRYALEMNQGWFKTKNLTAGTKISGLPR
ncbi:signal peptide protein [Pandoraea pneumonica]|uniref:Signal peptide protein n=1 Tax=Pandoraea pneumonica TaxID=2508299 RepID=A0A5E4WKA4_9BURK|nr:signal peptide protein [Pandoraea pneumonica]